MITIENVELVGIESAMRGMRNPKRVPHVKDNPNDTYGDTIGEKDLKVATDLAIGGPVHAKYRRMIVCFLDVTAPLYWWKEFDTYKVGTVSNSCSTMHTITLKEFEPIDFSHEQLTSNYISALNTVIAFLNEARQEYLTCDAQIKAGNDAAGLWKHRRTVAWNQIIQLLPSSFNQRRTIMLNYEVLCNIYKWRKKHKLQEWVMFCKWIESLPYFNEIIKEYTNGIEE